jgi:ketosteroid isomerase-like protein
MHKIFLALAVAVLASGPVAASEKTDVMAVMHQWVDGFNKGDMKSSVATCADQTSIIDDIPPHEWHGAGGCSKWWDDFNAFTKANEITNGNVTLGKPRRIDITADRAYIVVPANFTYNMKGKPMKQSGSLVTVAMQKGASGWRMTGWAWGSAIDVAVKTGSGH